METYHDYLEACGRKEDEEEVGVGSGVRDGGAVWLIYTSIIIEVRATAKCAAIWLSLCLFAEQW